MLVHIRCECCCKKQCLFYSLIPSLVLNPLSSSLHRLLELNIKTNRLVSASATDTNISYQLLKLQLKGSSLMPLGRLMLSMQFKRALQFLICWFTIISIQISLRLIIHKSKQCSASPHSNNVNVDLVLSISSMFKTKSPLLLFIERNNYNHET